jgi:drug/metabolite transporter (DMT)-like permease
MPNRGATATLVATLACVVAAACWALNAVIAADTFGLGISPEHLAESRVIVALVPLAAYLAITRRDLLVPPRAAWPPIAAFGVCIVAVNFAYYVAIERVPVGVAIALQYTAPVLILVTAALVSRRAPRGAAWVAGGLTLIGAALVGGAFGRGESAGMAGGAADLDGLGLLAGAVAAVTFAGYLVSAEAAGRRGAHPVTTLFGGFVVAALLWAAILPIWSWPFHLLSGPQIVLRVLSIGLLGTLLPFGLTVAALRILSSSVAGIATTTEPVLAAALAWLLLGQQLGAIQVVGGGLVVAGVLIAQVVRPAPSSSAAVDATP